MKWILPLFFLVSCGHKMSSSVYVCTEDASYHQKKECKYGCGHMLKMSGKEAIKQGNKRCRSCY